jgi:integrase
MPKSLSDAAVRNAKPREKPYKLSDGEGLFLLIHPSGAKYWRLRYFFAGKEKLLALGVYPQISLGEARQKRFEARNAIAHGNDPGEIKKQEKQQLLLNQANTFEEVTREWLAKRTGHLSDTTRQVKEIRLERYAYPSLGNKPIAEINAPDVLAMVRKIEKRGTFELARRVLQMTGQIFAYAIATGRADRNPVPDLRGAIETPKVTHRAYLKERELPDFLVKLEAYDGHPQTKLALKLLLLTFVRTTELRAAEWIEIDWKKGEWRIPASRMKMKQEHIVPLSKQSLSLLKELRLYSGNREHLFPNWQKPTGYMSENTMLYALYRMGYHSRTTGHGFRSTASTILNENGFRADVIERQLAHTERNNVRAAYNHAQYLTERREMMQWWADYLAGIVK